MNFGNMYFFGCILLLIHSGCVFSAVSSTGRDYNLNIIHYNDFHARYEETTVSDAVCRVNNGSCLGGFPRLYHQIRTLLAEKPDALLLNVGDTFQGTYWYTLLKWNIAQEFMNLLPHDAHAIGNHEFDDGPEGLVPYLRALKAPVLAANMDTTEEPSLIGTYKPSVIVERNGRKIGIIGLITVDTEAGRFVSINSPVEDSNHFFVVIDSSLSHLKLTTQLARDYGQYVDIIVGGHTHSLLWNGKAPSGEPVADTYPVFIESAADKKHKVLIVQASSFSKYMGMLSVCFDGNGDYVKWEGGPIFLDRSIPEDLDIKKKLGPYAKLVHEAESKPVGESLVILDAQDCSSGECTLGNMLTDAMVEYAKENVNQSRHYLAFVQQGNILSKKIEKGTITQVDVFDMYPFVDRILLFEMKGEFVRRVLESAVSEAKSLNPFEGSWLQQVSGLQVTYNVSRAEGDRVTSVTVGKHKLPLDSNQYYNILTAKFATFLGEGFPAIYKFCRNVREIGRDQNTLEAYIKKHSPLNVSTSGRIVINN